MKDSKLDNEELYKALVAEFRKSQPPHSRVKELMRANRKSRDYVLDVRARLIRDAMTLRPSEPEAELTARVDEFLGLRPPN